MNTLFTLMLALVLVMLSVSGLRAEEISPDQFFVKFVFAIQTKDIDRIKDLILKNPQTTIKVQEILHKMAQDGKDSDTSRLLAEALGVFMSSYFDNGDNPAMGDKKNVQEKREDDSSENHRHTQNTESSCSVVSGSDKEYSFLLNLMSTAVSYIESAQYTKALEYYEKALTFNKRHFCDPEIEAALLADIGTISGILGNYYKALNNLEKSVNLFRKLNDSNMEATVYINFGSVYKNLGQYQNSIEYLSKALSIHRNFNDRLNESKDLNNLGLIYKHIGQYTKALKYYNLSLHLKQEIGEFRGKANTLSNIGTIYLILEQYEKAEAYYQQALVIFDQIGERTNKATTLDNLGNVYSVRGQHERAIKYTKQALNIHRSNGHLLGQARVLNHLGMEYMKLNQDVRALSALKEGLSISLAIDDYGSWLTQRNWALIQTRLGWHTEATSEYEKSLDMIESLRSNLVGKEHKLVFMQNKLFVYDELIDLLKFLYKKQPNKGYDRKALEIFERKQGRIFLEEMGESGARRFAGIPENLVQDEADLVQRIEATRKSRTEALTQGKDAEPHRKLLEKLQAEQADFEKTLQADYPAYYALKYPEPVTLETLQKDVLQADELMLIYNVREEATDLWVVGKEHFALFSLPLTEAQVQQQVTAFREVGIKTMLNEINTANEEQLKDAALIRHLEGAVEENLPDFIETSHALYQQLLPEKVRELVAKAEPSTLYIVPTSALYSLPFESLVTEPDEDEQRYLLQDYAIAYLSSASLLKTLREAQHRRELTEREPLLAFADPVYPQKSCQALSQGDSIKTLRTRAYQKLLAGGEGACFPPLPETADEVEAIAKLFSVNSYSRPKPLHLQEDASVETVELFNENEELDELFSTHAILPNEVDYIKQPALVLSYPEQNGYLKMAEVFGLQMNADLVMLSACNTGRGDIIKGEGVRGLTRAFMYAGTPAVAVTLWSVESLASQQLGIHFFTQLKNKQPVANGLRQAKLAMLKDEKSHSRHPYFWAGFVVFGDGL